jgi:hypothetical protein
VTWQRIVIGSLLILAGTYAVAIVSALTMGSWQIYGQTLEAAVAASRRANQCALRSLGARTRVVGRSIHHGYRQENEPGTSLLMRISTPASRI